MRACRGSRANAGWALAVLGLLTGGCNKKPAMLPPVPIKGQVVFADGRPVTKMVLALSPAEEANKKAKAEALLLDDTGTFSANLVPGKYKATLSPIPRQTGGPDGAAGGGGPIAVPGVPEASEVPPGYTTELVVPEGGKQDVVLTVNVAK